MKPAGFLLLLLLLLLASTSFAQTSGSTPAPVLSPTTAGSPADTVKAIRMLFARRRSGGWLYTAKLPTYSFVPALALFLLDTNPAGLALVGTSIGVGIGKFVRFSPKKEEALIAAYQQGQPVPDAIRKRLKEKYFK